jgi:hypothetical protein
MFRAYVPAEDAQSDAGAVVDVHGRSMVCLAECPSLEELRLEVADAWESEVDLLITDPDGLIVSRG